MCLLPPPLAAVPKKNQAACFNDFRERIQKSESCTNQLKNNFFPTAIRLLNGLTPSLHPSYDCNTTVRLFPSLWTVCLLFTVALRSIIMKCFQRLVMAQINSSLPDILDPLQFAYRRNRSTADAISLALHSTVEHLDNKDTYLLTTAHRSTKLLPCNSSPNSMAWSLALPSAAGSWTS